MRQRIGIAVQISGGNELSVRFGCVAGLSKQRCQSVVCFGEPRLAEEQRAVVFDARERIDAFEPASLEEGSAKRFSLVTWRTGGQERAIGLEISVVSGRRNQDWQRPELVCVGDDFFQSPSKIEQDL